MLTSSVAAIREMERCAITSGIAEYALMRRAGENAAALIARLFPSPARYVVLCGSGNNGGDALVAAAKLSTATPVVVFAQRAKNEFKGCAAHAAADLPDTVSYFHQPMAEPFDLRPGDVVIDSLLGIGFDGGALRPGVKNWIAAANGSHLPVIALDLPSGIHGDSGKASADGAVNAALTITFGRPKRGLFCNDGARLRGTLRVVDIGLPEHQSENGDFEVMTNCDAVQKIVRFSPEVHKNQRGRVLVWGGSSDYPGASLLTSQAALRAGAGIVRCASRGTVEKNGCHALICRSTDAIPDEWMKCSDALAAGCGWGSGVPAECLAAVLNFPGTVILDADGLNLASRHPDLWRKRENLILTPHVGEATRLADAFGVTVDPDRRAFASALAQKTGAVVLLKGRDTVVAAPDARSILIAAGSPALATAGSGDVLSGTIAALAASGLSPFDAAALGSYLHGIAGECATGTLIADELPALIGKTISLIRRNDLF